MVTAARLLTLEPYERIALAEPERRWELHDGALREKTVTAYAHNRWLSWLSRRLFAQQDEYDVRANPGRVSRSATGVYIPDLAVIPIPLTRRFERHPDALEVYDQPLPLVVEIWSPATGSFDLQTKIPAYQRRGGSRDLALPSVRSHADGLTPGRVR